MFLKNQYPNKIYKDQEADTVGKCIISSHRVLCWWSSFPFLASQNTPISVLPDKTVPHSLQLYLSDSSGPERPHPFREIGLMAVFFIKVLIFRTVGKITKQQKQTYFIL